MVNRIYRAAPEISIFLRLKEERKCYFVLSLSILLYYCTMSNRNPHFLSFFALRYGPPIFLPPIWINYKGPYRGPQLKRNNPHNQDFWLVFISTDMIGKQAYKIVKLHWVIA